MITHRYPVTGGCHWDDLEADRPWFDPAIEADRLQDRETRAAAIAERFGPLLALEVEHEYARPPLPVIPAPTIGAGYATQLVDNDITRYARRRALVAALDDPPADHHREDLDPCRLAG